MIRAIFAALWLLGLFTAGIAGSSVTQAAVVVGTVSPTAVVERFHLTLIENMKGGKELGFEGRRKKLDTVVKECFDLPMMARLSTGAAWQKLPEDDKAKIVTAFTDWTIANYAANFDEWNGEAFVTKDETDDGKGNIVVNTRLTQKEGAPVVFNYRMHKQDDGWRIVDIYLEGAISQLAMRRGEFSAVLARGGVNDLVKHMHDLTEQAVHKGST